MLRLGLFGAGGGLGDAMGTFEQLTELAERLGGGARGASEETIAALPTRTVGTAPSGGEAPAEASPSPAATAPAPAPSAVPPPQGADGQPRMSAAGAAAAARAAAAAATAAAAQRPPSSSAADAAEAPPPGSAAPGGPVPSAPSLPPQPDVDGTCAVCLSDFCVGEELRDLRCGHAFHASCIDTWLRVRAVCPVCKADLDGRPATN